MSPTQTESGKAFEYALASAISKASGAQLIQNPACIDAKLYFQASDPAEQKNMEKAATKASSFLCSNDQNFGLAQSAIFQKDFAGQRGDVRDIIVTLSNNQQIGLSAKNNHEALKHSRLSNNIDFGKKWGNFSVSKNYWNMVAPTFQEMQNLGNSGTLFKNIKDKENRFYLPILIAFEDEFRSLCETHGSKFISSVFHYLIGNFDFYKVMYLRRQNAVQVQPFNLNGTLGWGQKWKLPSKIDSIRRGNRSRSTIIIAFEGGWQISFRLHNATSKVEPSLKFDINFVSMPPYATGNQMPI